MAARASYESFADMPPGLRHFLFSNEFSTADESLQKNFSLSPEQGSAVGDVVMDIIFNKLSLLEGAAAIKEAVVPAPIEEAKWKAFFSEVLKFEIWPLRELFGEELRTFLQEADISTSGWPQTQVLLRPMTYSGAASEVAARAGFSLMASGMRERMRDLIMSKIKGVRIDSQIKDVLMRQADFGGLGLDAAMADKVIASMKDVLEAVPVMSEDEYGDYLAEEARKKAEANAPAKDPAQAVDGVSAAAQTDSAAIQARVALVKPSTALDQSVDKAWESIGNKPADPYLAKRLKNIISSRLRDVRNAIELRQLLARDEKVGGMGYSMEVAETVSEQIEAAYALSHDLILGEEKKKLEEQMEYQRRKIEERKAREVEEHAKWYKERVQSRTLADAENKKVGEKMRQGFAAAQSPVDAKAQKMEEKRFGELVPVTAVTAPAMAMAGGGGVSAGQTPFAPSVATMPTQAQPTARAAFIAPMASGTVAAPVAPPVVMPSGVKVSKTTVEMQSVAATAKPRMEDVKLPPGLTQMNAPRLSGLVQELHALDLPEFRRLGKTPEVAAQKILQKVETLAGESFEKRIEGIKAFQESPLQRAYVGLLSESFKAMKPIAELSEQKRAAGQDALSPDEIASIISLNSKLHF